MGLKPQMWALIIMSISVVGYVLAAREEGLLIDSRCKQPFWYVPTWMICAYEIRNKDQQARLCKNFKYLSDYSHHFRAEKITRDAQFRIITTGEIAMILDPRSLQDKQQDMNLKFKYYVFPRIGYPIIPAKRMG